MQDKTPLWNHLGSNKLHTREPSDTTGCIQKQKNFTMWVRLLCGAHVVWDCLFNRGYPGFGVPVPLFIGYLISNLILLKTNPSNDQGQNQSIYTRFYKILVINILNNLHI